MARSSNNMKLVQQSRSTVAATKSAAAKTKSKATDDQVTYDSVLQDALLGISKGIEALTDIVTSASSEPKDKIAAAKAVAQILLQLADAKVTEKLPLLEELERNVKQTA